MKAPSQAQRARYEMIADIAAVFHWQPSEILALDAADLETWHRLALARDPKRRES